MGYAVCLIGEGTEERAGGGGGVSPAAGLQQAVPHLQGGHAEVRYPHIVLLVQQEVLRLQVSVTGHVCADTRA